MASVVPPSRPGTDPLPLPLEDALFYSRRSEVEGSVAIVCVLLLFVALPIINALGLSGHLSRVAVGGITLGLVGGVLVAVAGGYIAVNRAAKRRIQTQTAERKTVEVGRNIRELTQVQKEQLKSFFKVFALCCYLILINTIAVATSSMSLREVCWYNLILPIGICGAVLVLLPILICCPR